ncbi:MAG: hypothetical protein FJY79_07120 [Candidatus Aminicenantes bacterium]|nr:hypothetical protein [Candidatus Aminicenantes bacterium]
MAKMDIAALEKALEAAGLDAATKDKVKNTYLENMPEKTIHTAVLFLGIATLILAVGSVGLAIFGKPIPEALWTVLGACVGGLAGIYMGKQ